MNRLEQIAMYMRMHDEELAIKKKTVKWKARNIWYRMKKWAKSLS